MKYISAALAAAALAASSTAVSLNYKDDGSSMIDSFVRNADDGAMSLDAFKKKGIAFYVDLWFKAIDTDGNDKVTTAEFYKFVNDAYNNYDANDSSV